VQAYEARKKLRERNQMRLANMGRRTSLGDDLEAGQAGTLQYARQRRQQRAADRRSPTRKGSDAPPG
jgi:hypothetical protein